ncbi:cyclically-permuted mutarotase family protein [Capnocytophaga genosp. AHN8471]|uniref:Cyclically-permuted mutarotase family protein n=1 Tax=Capnocytophaga genosp. AHN8471 TaxID=327574 RepID=A0ABS1YU02_9FLAO|nr:cyclically-permuted mutarotase family protein [Capnocytophaga genosp. AHN8471]MBM0649711.1 cyclically-permuted mutarotase family protein [Capnocytophaga genosp. AHN8471]MBM0662557.1 cyclically-permuted mutarotase family protein [Capnocytophaga genosp. AHN8471]
MINDKEQIIYKTLSKSLILAVLRSLTKSVLFVLSLIILTACTETQKEQSMKMNITALTTQGLEGDLQKGVSAAYAALIDDNLLVAGGCNFPDKLGFEGGKKVFYDEILLFNKTQNQWQTIGKLPEAAAYGVSVAIPDGYLWIGGQTATNSLANCYKVQYTKEKGLTLTDFPALPEPLDNFAGTSIGSKVFVAGGNASGKPSNKVYYIDTATDKEWHRLADFPETASVQPVVAAVTHENDTHLYLFGGFFGGDTTQAPALITTVWRYSLQQQQWQKVATEETADKKLFTLTGATALAIDNRYIACFGGVNASLFINTITDLYHIGRDTALTDEAHKQKNYDYMAHYMTQPIAYYKFNQECYLFDTLTKQWSVLDTQPDFARAGATLVGTPNEFYLIQGELKPGVRSSKTYKLKILSN